MLAVVKHAQKMKVIQTSAFACCLTFSEVKNIKLTGH